MAPTFRLVSAVSVFLSTACLTPVAELPEVVDAGSITDAGGEPTDAGTSPLDAGLTPLSCAPGAWCWQHPTPQGQPLNTVFAVSPTEAWALGDHGATVHFESGVWTALAPIADLTLRHAWGTSGTNIWAIGQRVLNSQAAESALLHFDGTRWATVPHGSLPRIDDVVGSASGEVWTLTASNSTTVKPVLQRWNGTAFVATPALPASLRANSLCVRSATEVWVTVNDDQNSWPFALYRWNGVAWSLVHQLPAGSSRRFDSRVMCPADGVAVVEVFEFDTAKYAYLETRGSQVIFSTAPRGGALLRSAHGEVFSVDSRTVSQWTPTGWQPRFTLASDESMYSVAFDFVGGSGWLTKQTPTVSSWDGSAFVAPANQVGTLRAFVTPGPRQDPSAVFGEGSWGRRSGEAWVFAATPMLSSGRPLHVSQAFSLPGGDAWLVGNAIARFDAATQTITPVLTGEFTTIDGTDESTLWAVGGREVRRFDGRQWVAPSVPLPDANGLRPANMTFTAVAVRSATDVTLLGNDVAGGAFATIIYQWDGASWRFTVSFGATLAVLDRDTVGDLYTVEGDTVKKRAPSASTWTPVGRVNGSVQRLRVDGPDQLELVLRTRTGLVLSRWDAAQGRFTQDAPELQLDGAVDLLRGSTTRVWAIGDHGALLRYEPPN